MKRNFTILLILWLVIILFHVSYSQDQIAPANEYKYVGNIKSKIYHKLKCRSAKKLKSKNCMYFKDKEEAEKQGFIPCKVCKP
jgi:methylphosphotriester-DNA--protein-cysteine methyltransferase